MRTLGIDLGTSSLGWCLVDTRGEPLASDEGSIVAIGTRIFGDGREPKSGASLAVDRRAARAMRRRRDRYLSRRAALLSVLTEYGLMPADEDARQQLVRKTNDGKSRDSGPRRLGKPADVSTSVHGPQPQRPPHHVAGPEQLSSSENAVQPQQSPPAMPFC